MGGWPGGRVAGWPGGWLEKVELRLFSTQVEAVVDLKLELSLATVIRQILGSILKSLLLDMELPIKITNDKFIRN